MNKFLEGGGSDVTDGSTNILGATLSAVNLDSSKALKTNGSKIIISTDLAIADTAGLQAAWILRWVSHSRKIWMWVVSIY